MGRVMAAENKITIVQLGGLEPLIRQMLSPNVEVQCNAVGCITNLATHGESPVLDPGSSIVPRRFLRGARTSALISSTYFARAQTTTRTRSPNLALSSR